VTRLPDGIERLREHLHRHNRWVLLITIITFAAAVALWAGLYTVTWWLFLLGSTAARPFDLQPATGALLRGFATTGLLLCVAAWIARRLHPNEAPQDHKNLGGHFLDLLLAVPRLTLSIFGTGRAAARLSDSELEHAWRLLRRMSDAGHPVPIQTVPVDIPDSAMRDKIVLTLQLSGLIEMRTTSGGPVLAFRNKEARRLAQERVRLRF